MSGSGISSAICKSAPRSRQITTPVPHHWVFYRLDALPAAQPTPSRHWRQPERRLWLLRIFQFSVHHPALYVSACRLLHVAVVACLDMYRHHQTASPEVDWEHLITDRRHCYPQIIERLHDRRYHAVDVGVWRLVSAVGCAGSMMIQFSRMQSSLTSGYILNVPAFQLFVPYFSLITLGTGHCLLTSNRTVE